MTEQVSPQQEAAIRRRQTARLVVIAVIVAVAAALAIDNRQDVALSYLVGERSAPLIIALVVAFLLGAIAGRLTSSRRTSRDGTT